MNLFDVCWLYNCITSYLKGMVGMVVFPPAENTKCYDRPPLGKYSGPVGSALILFHC